MSARSHKSSFVTVANSVALVVLVAMIVPAMIGFGGGYRAIEVFGAVAVLAAATLGIPAALRWTARFGERRPAAGESNPPETVRTASGRLHRREALVQVLVVPVSAFVAMCLLAAAAIAVIG